MSEGNITVAAAVAALATSVLAVLLFGLGLDQVPLRGQVVSLVTIGLYVFAADAILNVLSGVIRQTNRGLNRLDFGMTVFRTVVITLTLGFVLYMTYSVKDEFVGGVMATPNAWTLLYILFGFTWFDLLVIQGRKNRGLRTSIGSGASVHAASATAMRDQVIPPVGGYPEGHEPEMVESDSGLPEAVTEVIFGMVPVIAVQDEDGNWIRTTPTQRVANRFARRYPMLRTLPSRAGREARGGGDEGPVVEHESAAPRRAAVTPAPGAEEPEVPEVIDPDRPPAGDAAEEERRVH